MLKNECDEEFRFVQKQVKDTVNDLVKVFVKRRNPNKSEKEVTALVAAKFKGAITETEWTEIVKYMYNEDDTNLIQDRISGLITSGKSSLDTSQKISREEAEIVTKMEKKKERQIEFKLFLKSLLDFQLKGHDK